MVALRKESVDRNDAVQIVIVVVHTSLSARRAWIEMPRNHRFRRRPVPSLSARRAWIEISIMQIKTVTGCVALRKESVDRNF